MAKALAVKTPGTIGDWTPQQVAILKNLIAKDATDDELGLFSMVCKKSGLDPFSRQIYFQKRKDHKSGDSKMTIISSIDGFRAIAHRTEAHAGTDDAVYEYGKDEKPTKASVTVYRLVAGQRCPFTASARWAEYCPSKGLDFMWNKFPTLMLGKCAEALALRKAFSSEIGSMYTPEEMAQAASPMPEKTYSEPERASETSQAGAAKPMATAEQIKLMWNKLRQEYKLTEEQAKNTIVAITGKESTAGMTIDQMEAALEMGFKIAHPKEEAAAK